MRLNFLTLPAPVDRFLWRHKVRGTAYQVQSLDCRVQCPDDAPLRDGEKVTLYRNVEDGTWSIRRGAEFADGRFEKLTWLG